MILAQILVVSRENFFGQDLYLPPVLVHLHGSKLESKDTAKSNLKLPSKKLSPNVFPDEKNLDL